MRCYEALQEIMKVIYDEPLICNLGHPAQELYSLRDRPQNFYMLGSMGLATSIAHDLALYREGKVLVIDGDASVTMNIGGFATVGGTQPKNLVQIIIDNGANGSTGFQPSFTAGRLKLEEVARACGIPEVSVVTQQKDVAPAVAAALRSNEGLCVILIRSEGGMLEGIAAIPIDALQIKNRFMESVAC